MDGRKHNSFHPAGAQLKKIGIEITPHPVTSQMDGMLELVCRGRTQPIHSRRPISQVIVIDDRVGPILCRIGRRIDTRAVIVRGETEQRRIQLLDEHVVFRSPTPTAIRCRRSVSKRIYLKPPAIVEDCGHRIHICFVGIGQPRLLCRVEKGRCVVPRGVVVDSESA